MVKKKCTKGKPSRLLLISLCNTIILLLLTYALNNQAVFTGEDLNQYAWMELLKEKLGLSKHKDYKDALFFNVSYDKQLVDKYDDYGMPIGNVDVTDRTKLLRILNLLDSTRQYRYIFLDVRFEKGIISQADSVLFEKIRNMRHIVIANHSDIELADSALLEKSAISDYTSTIVATNFARYKYLYGQRPSMPLYAYREITGKEIKKHGMIYTCNGKLCYNSLFLKFPTFGFAEYDESNQKTYYNLGSDILNNYTKSELSSLTKDKLLFIGDMVEDMHDTYSGLKPGVIITYHAIHSLLNGEHFVSYGLMFFLALVFFLISLSLFYKISIIEQIPFIKRSQSKILHYAISFIGYTFVLFAVAVVLNLFFDISTSIVVPLLSFSILKAIIDFKTNKK